MGAGPNDDDGAIQFAAGEGAPRAAKGRRPARTAEDFPLPDGPTTARKVDPASLPTMSATRRSPPEDTSTSSTSKRREALERGFLGAVDRRLRRASRKQFRPLARELQVDYVGGDLRLELPEAAPTDSRPAARLSEAARRPRRGPSRRRATWTRAGTPADAWRIAAIGAPRASPPACNATISTTASSVQRREHDAPDRWCRRRPHRDRPSRSPGAHGRRPASVDRPRIGGGPTPTRRRRRPPARALRRPRSRRAGRRLRRASLTPRRGQRGRRPPRPCRVFPIPCSPAMTMTPPSPPRARRHAHRTRRATASRPRTQSASPSSSARGTSGARPCGTRSRLPRRAGGERVDVTGLPRHGEDAHGLRESLQSERVARDDHHVGDRAGQIGDGRAREHLAGLGHPAQSSREVQRAASGTPRFHGHRLAGVQPDAHTQRQGGVGHRLLDEQAPGGRARLVSPDGAEANTASASSPRSSMTDPASALDALPGDGGELRGKLRGRLVAPFRCVKRV